MRRTMEATSGLLLRPTHPLSDWAPRATVGGLSAPAAGPSRVPRERAPDQLLM